MAAIREECSVCSREFDVTFRYQMEERDGGFAFFCSQECLNQSQTVADDGADTVVCDACAKRFTVSLASQVLYVGGKRRYACGMSCRSQLVREASGMLLGDVGREPATAEPSVQPATAVATVPRIDPNPPATFRPATSRPVGPAEALPAPTGNRVERPRPPRGRVVRGRSAPRRIAVFNHKGGTGKTTTSVSLAAGLADRGYRVLLVDTDSQGNVGVSLGVEGERSLYHVLVMGLRVQDAVQRLRPGLDLLPSNETLAAAELYLAGRQNRDRVLSQRIGDAVEAYDYVIIDCSPSLSLMNQNALTLADSVLVPVACDYLSLVGVRQVIKTVKNVNKLLRHPLQIWGVLPTMFDARANICTEALSTLREHFGERCLEPIRASTKLKEAPAQARTIFEHAPGTKGAEDYEALLDAVEATRSEGRRPPAREPNARWAAHG
ncbi:MAG: AAA family ATPase [Myxococcota bacterium]